MNVENTPASPPYVRNAAGQWGKGNAGRQLGSKNKTARNRLSAVQDIADEAIVGLRELVDQRNLAAIRIVLDFSLPKGGRSIELESSNPNAIIDALADGTLSPDEGARLAQAFKTAGDAADLQDLKVQVEQLEILISSLRK